MWGFILPVSLSLEMYCYMCHLFVAVFLWILVKFYHMLYYTQFLLLHFIECLLEDSIRFAISLLLHFIPTYIKHDTGFCNKTLQLNIKQLSWANNPLRILQVLNRHIFQNLDTLLCNIHVKYAWLISFPYPQHMGGQIYPNNKGFSLEPNAGITIGKGFI